MESNGEVSSSRRGVLSRASLYRTKYMPCNENYKEEPMTPFKIECPNCEGNRTFAVPETAYTRFCADCEEEFDIRPPDLIAEDALYD